MKDQEPNRKGKKVNLRVWMGIKIIPALMLFLYYWMCVRTDYKTNYTLIQNSVFVLMFVFILIIGRKTEAFDELAKENLHKTDSICLKISYIIMGIILLPTAFTTPSSVIIGYLISGGIVVLTILRTIIFYAIDRRGL